MNVQAKETTTWAEPASEPTGADAPLLSRWRAAVDAIRNLAAVEGWSKSEAARRADIPLGTFSSWYDGTYTGRYDTQTQRVENFLAARQATSEIARGMPVAPGFVQTRVARELFTAFTYAQMVPTISLVILGSGLGKSMAARAYKASRPHVTHVTLSPSSAAVHTLKGEIAQEMGLECRDVAKAKKMITDALRRPDGYHSLLIIDEAQNLSEDAINELRHFRDQAGWAPPPPRG